MLEGRKQKQQQRIEKKWSCPGNKSKQGHGGMDADLSYVLCHTGSMTTFPRTVFINLRLHWNSGSACHNTAPLPQKLCLAFDHLLLISIHPTPNSGRWKNSSFICIFFLDVDLTATCTQRCSTNGVESSVFPHELTPLLRWSTSSLTFFFFVCLSVFKERAWQKQMFLPKNILLNQELQFGLIQTHNIRKRGEKKPNSPVKLNGGERTSCCCNEDLSFTVPAVNHKLPTRVSAHRAFKYTQTKRPCLSFP